MAIRYGYHSFLRILHCLTGNKKIIKKNILLIFALAGIFLFITSASGQNHTPDDGNVKNISNADGDKPSDKATGMYSGLADVLSIEDESKWTFLEKLDEHEQIQLTQMIQLRLEEEGGLLVSLMTKGTTLLPTFLAVKFAQRLEPDLVAKLSDKLPVEKAVRITKGLNRDFLADVTKHLKPKKASIIINQCPDELVIDVSRKLIEKGEPEVAGRLADYLSVEKLTSLAKKRTVNENVQVAHHMKNREVIAKILAVFPDDVIIELMQESSRLGYHTLVADVAKEVNKDRLVQLFAHLNKDDVAKTLALADPGVFSSIIKELDKQTVSNITVLLPADKLAIIINALPPELINELWRYISTEKLIETLPYIDLDKLAHNWTELKPEVTGLLIKVSDQYDPLASKIKSMSKK